MQMEYVECGAASLCMILAYYGKYVPLEQVRKDCNISRDGSRASLILTAAENYGLKADGYRYSVESCMTKVRYPAIIHWNMSHFVVLRGFGKDKAYLNDPGLGEITVSMEEFNKSFTGIVLEFEPGEEFKRDGVRPGVWKSVLKWMGQNRQGTLFVFLTALVIAMVGVFVPLFQRVFLDNILNSAQIWKRGFYIFIFCLGLTELTADTLSQVYNYRIRGVFGIRLNMDFFRHLLRLPMDFYSQRSPGELIGRLSLGSTITQTLFDKVVPMAVQMLMAVLYFLVMLQISPVLAVVVAGLVLLNIAVSNIASRYTVRFMQQRMNASMQMDAVMVSGIVMVETIKSSGVAAGYFSRWASWQAAVNAGKTMENRTNSILMGASQLIKDLTSAIILTFCAYFIIHGHFTIGVLLAFQTLATKIAEPATDISETLKGVKELTTSINKIEDVMHYEREDVFKEDSLPELERDGITLLTGEIEFRGLTFGYSRSVPALFENMNLAIRPGESIAFVGSSGSGKSTAAKLLAGLLTPWEGEVLYDGKPLKDIMSPVFHASVAMVNQDSAIFEDSVRNNIIMWDRTIDGEEITRAAKAASIHADILKMSGGYDHKLSSGGRNLSGGQRQRIGIARALAKKPEILILDEATSALDAVTERRIMDNIKELGITTVIVAHRLSTVRGCDRIIVLEHGRIVETGTHDDLIEKKGAYYKLVSMV